MHSNLICELIAFVKSLIRHVFNKISLFRESRSSRGKKITAEAAALIELNCGQAVCTG